MEVFPVDIAEAKLYMVSKKGLNTPLMEDSSR